MESRPRVRLLSPPMNSSYMLRAAPVWGRLLLRCKGLIDYNRVSNTLVTRFESACCECHQSHPTGVEGFAGLNNSRQQYAVQAGKTIKTTKIPSQECVMHGMQTNFIRLILKKNTHASAVNLESTFEGNHLRAQPTRHWVRLFSNWWHYFVSQSPPKTAA